MAYYPGNYYRSAFQHIADYYSQGLFSATTPWPHDFDPYTDSYQLEGHDRHHERSLQRSASRHRPYPTRNTPTNPPPSSSPPRSSPPPPNHHPEPSLQTPSLPPPALPSPSYLDFASKPSKTLTEPTRKLLVLDLNGALLLRSPRIPKSYRGQYQHHQGPAPRRVMPRPYLTSLRAYIFAPQTRVWLDVMVWSSAQPHSVDDMVSHAFGSDGDQLIAIWARDTLGLEEDHYYRKVQTIKDLEKPWAALTPQSPSPKSNHELQPPSSQTRTQTQTQTWTGHSAATTILLDDSHAKAARQPHNHLCVPEYTRARRNADLAALKHASSAREAEDGGTSPSSPPPPQDDTTGKPRKRKRKREKEQEQEQQSPSATHASAAAPALDETLLAVVGILHAARLQSSIAGWMRAGGLLSGRDTVWWDDPELVHMWALRGREAMRELRLETEHGVVPDP